MLQSQKDAKLKYWYEIIILSSYIQLIYMYIYIYTERKRERETEKRPTPHRLCHFGFVVFCVEQIWKWKCQMCMWEGCKLKWKIRHYSFCWCTGITIFKRGFIYQLFFRAAGLQHKLLILIVSPTYFTGNQPKKSKLCVVFEAKFGPRSNVVEKKNTQRNWYFNGFFSYFAWGIAAFTSKR